MSKINAFETDWLEYIFQNTALAAIGDATGLQASSVDGNLWVHLYTSDPGETGTPAGVCTYGSYAGVSVARSAVGWTVAAGSVTNAAAVTFPQATSGSEIATHFAVTFGTGSSQILYYGTLDSPVTISTGVTPAFAIGDLTINED